VEEVSNGSRTRKPKESYPGLSQVAHECQPYQVLAGPTTRNVDLIDLGEILGS